MSYDLDPGWGELSPEAEKAIARSRGMANVWASRLACQLARTQDKAILRWPDYGGRAHRAKIRDWIAQKLPAYQFNNQHNWFEAPLDQLQAAADLLPELNISQGARQYLLQEKENAE